MSLMACGKLSVKESRASITPSESSYSGNARDSIQTLAGKIVKRNCINSQKLQGLSHSTVNYHHYTVTENFSITASIQAR